MQFGCQKLLNPCQRQTGCIFAGEFNSLFNIYYVFYKSYQKKECRCEPDA